MSTLKEVAELCGVSIKTVSNVVNGASNVGASTRERVMEAIGRLGYVPSQAARGLVLGLDPARPARFHSGRNIGCVLGRGFDRYADSYYSAVFRGLEWELRRGGHFLLFAERVDDLERNPVLMNTLFSPKAIDGLISFARAEKDFLMERIDASTPVVSIGKADGMECVVTDKAQAIRLSVEHLLSLGHRRIGFLGGQALVDGKPDERFGSFLAELGAGRFESDPSWRIGLGSGFDAGWAAAQELMRLPERPGAVICVSDKTAIGAMHAFLAAGVRIPQDISVLGYDNIPESEAVYPQLSTVDVDKDAVGATAARMLLNRIENPSLPKASCLMPVKFIARASSAPPRGEL